MLATKSKTILIKVFIFLSTRYFNSLESYTLISYFFIYILDEKLPSKTTVQKTCPFLFECFDKDLNSDMYHVTITDRMGTCETIRVKCVPWNHFVDFKEKQHS